MTNKTFKSLDNDLKLDIKNYDLTDLKHIDFASVYPNESQQDTCVLPLDKGETYGKTLQPKTFDYLAIQPEGPSNEYRTSCIPTASEILMESEHIPPDIGTNPIDLDQMKMFQPYCENATEYSKTNLGALPKEHAHEGKTQNTIPNSKCEGLTKEHLSALQSTPAFLRTHDSKRFNEKRYCERSMSTSVYQLGLLSYTPAKPFIETRYCESSMLNSEAKLALLSYTHARKFTATDHTTSTAKLPVYKKTVNKMIQLLSSNSKYNNSDNVLAADKGERITELNKESCSPEKSEHSNGQQASQDLMNPEDEEEIYFSDCQSIVDEEIVFDNEITCILCDDTMCDLEIVPEFVESSIQAQTKLVGSTTSIALKKGEPTALHPEQEDISSPFSDTINSLDFRTSMSMKCPSSNMPSSTSVTKMMNLPSSKWQHGLSANKVNILSQAMNFTLANSSANAQNLFKVLTMNSKSFQELTPMQESILALEKGEQTTDPVRPEVKLEWNPGGYKAASHFDLSPYGEPDPMALDVAYSQEPYTDPLHSDNKAQPGSTTGDTMIKVQDLCKDTAVGETKSMVPMINKTESSSLSVLKVLNKMETGRKRGKKHFMIINQNLLWQRRQATRYKSRTYHNTYILVTKTELWGASPQILMMLTKTKLWGADIAITELWGANTGINHTELWGVHTWTYSGKLKDNKPKLKVSHKQGHFQRLKIICDYAHKVPYLYPKVATEGLDYYIIPRMSHNKSSAQTGQRGVVRFTPN
jgi:hypothetical protein